MQRFNYKYEVLNSKLVPTRSFERVCDNDEQAENLRKTLEGELGFPVLVSLLGSVESDRTGSAYESVNHQPETIQPETTPFVYDLEANRVVPQSDAPDDLKLFPRNWQKRKVHVSESGRVYHFGVEQPELRGTVTASV